MLALDIDVSVPNSNPLTDTKLAACFADTAVCTDWLLYRYESGVTVAVSLGATRSNMGRATTDMVWNLVPLSRETLAISCQLALCPVMVGAEDRLVAKWIANAIASNEPLV